MSGQPKPDLGPTTLDAMVATWAHATDAELEAAIAECEAGLRELRLQVLQRRQLLRGPR